MPEHIEKAVFTAVGHCEVGASLFMCGKDLITPFSPPWWYCEARGGLYKCQSISKKKKVLTAVQAL